MLILVPLRMITIMLKDVALLSLGSVMKISIRMPIIVDIWVFVCMISFMLGQVEHETRIFFAS